MSFLTFIVLPSFVLVSALVLRYIRSRGNAYSHLPLPPGPNPLPLIGNILDIPSETPWKTYDVWARQYGDVMCLRLPGQHLIILNSVNAVLDLLERRSSNYSDKERTEMLTLTGWDWGLGNMTYGPLWRRHRRLFHQYFNQHAVTAYKQDLEEASHKLLQRLLLQPEKFVYHLRYMLGAEFLSAVYGIHDAEEIDQYLAIAEKAIQGAEEALIPGSFLVDFLPTLKYVPAWMPGALFKRKAAEWKRNAMAMRNVPWQNVSAALDSHKPCIGASMLERISHLIGSEHAGEEEVAKNVAGTTYAAGSDTTYATLHIFFLAMVLYPDVQKRAQDEIAAVVGDDRLPNFSDYDKLMYLKAIWMECIRWQPAVPLGLAHKTLADDEYNGFRIPGRAIVMHNTWAILQDPKVYSEPKTFNPERFLRDGAWNLEVMDPAVIAFGAGRRICPGRYFAELSVFINAARILHTFDIMPALDAEGKQIKVEPDMTSGFVIHPKPFQCSIKPRSKAAESLIRGGNSDN